MKTWPGGLLACLLGASGRCEFINVTNHKRALSYLLHSDWFPRRPHHHPNCCMLLGIITPQKKIGHVSSKILEVPAIFVFTKEFPKKYKGKNAIKPFLLSFLAGRSNQCLVFTRLLHLYCCFHKNPYRSPLKPYGNMALWP